MFPIAFPTSQGWIPRLAFIQRSGKDILLSFEIVKPLVLYWRFAQIFTSPCPPTVANASKCSFRLGKRSSWLRWVWASKIRIISTAKKIKNQIFFMIMQYPTILNQRKKTTQLHIFRLSFIVDKYYWKRWEKCCSLREMRSEAADQCSKASESHVVLLWYWYQYAKLSA